ncbi:protein unc-93 homolog A-like [Amphiura filiformis]|uniref:protein unc-93 homolog A-like n=1 Tax=Amphiura filiformis TaxID=82378 RepID=UPI003B217C4C
MAASLVDHLTEFCQYVPDRKPLKKHMSSALKVLRSQEFLMLVPLMSFNGFEMGFAYGSFTKGYISCFLGIGSVGYAMAAFGAGGVLCAIFTAMFAQCTGRGRVVLLSVAFLVQEGLLCVFLLWEPMTGQPWHIYMMALALGAGISMRLFQIRVSLAVFFPEDKEATMATFMFIHSIALSFSTALSSVHSFCISHLIYIQLGWLTLAMIVYFLVEWKKREELAALQAIAVRKGSQEGMMRLRVRELPNGNRKISMDTDGYPEGARKVSLQSDSGC